MFLTIEGFLTTWKHEVNSTQKLLDVLTDESLAQEVSKEGRTLGQIVWHIIATIGEMMSHTGLRIESPTNAPASAKEIADSYRRVNEAFIHEIQTKWTDESLKEISDMYGEKWENGLTLSILISHQTHHRGQMTVLMRQAGLRVPGVCGPSREEWAEFGMEAPVE